VPVEVKKCQGPVRALSHWAAAKYLQHDAMFLCTVNSMRPCSSRPQQIDFISYHLPLTNSSVEHSVAFCAADGDVS
jgi:hypothetical protein